MVIPHNGFHTQEGFVKARQLRNLDTLHECSAALRDLQLLQKFVDKKGVPGFWDVTMSIGHGDKQATYQLPLAKLMPVLQNLEAELRGTLARSGYDTSALPPICVLTKQNGG